MEYDLYLDESGKFMKSGEPTLIGGFLIPHHKHFSEAMAADWCERIKGNLIHAGLQTETSLSNGQDVHRLRLRNRHLPDHEIELLIRQQNLIGYYIFEHCSENKLTANNKWGTQAYVLDEFAKRIASLNGKIVIFSNPNGEYHIDSTTTYMTIFSLGFLNLYRSLTEEDGTFPIIHIHAAERKNTLLSDEEELLADTPLPYMDQAGNPSRVLVSGQYIAQVKNCAFLNGGVDLLKQKRFVSALEQMEIVCDTRDSNGRFKPNALTVICDYICNSYYRKNKNREEITPIWQKWNSCCEIIDAFSPALAKHSFEIDRIRDEQTWGSAFFELLSMNYQTEKTALFFQELSKERYIVQDLAVESVVNSLYPFIEERLDMKNWCKRLERTIQIAKGIDPQAYFDLEANLYMYLHALQTHQGLNHECNVTA